MTSFSKIFYTLSLFFIFYFYILPLIVISNFTHLINSPYLLLVNEDTVFIAWLACFVFILGFILPDLFKIVSKKKVFVRKKYLERSFSGFKKLFWLLLFFYSLYLSSQLFDTDRTVHAYMVRTGEARGNWAWFLIQNIFSAIKLTLLLVMLNYSKKFYIIIYLCFIFFVEFFGGIGRTNLAIDVILIFMVIFNLRAYFVSVSFFFIMLFMPIIFNMKVFIYNLALGEEILFDVDLFSFDYDMFIQNFGYPVASMLSVNSLIDKVGGYRFFYDYIQGFIFYLKAFDIDAGDSLTYFNSEILIGIHSSTVPTGYMAFGYVQFGLLGVIVSGIFYRIVGLFAEIIFYKVSPFSEVSKFLLAFIAANSFYYGEIRTMVLTVFLILFTMFFLSDYMQKICIKNPITPI